MRNPEVMERLLKIRSKLKRLRNPETIEIYQSAENHMNLWLIRNQGMYFNSQGQFIKVADMHIMHLQNTIKKLENNSTNDWKYF